MKTKLVELQELSKDELFFIIGGQVCIDKKKKRKARKAERKRKRLERKAKRVCGSDATDTVKNDSFNIKI